MSENRFRQGKSVVIVGAGPAGLTAAYELTREGVPVIVFERESQIGGIARTVQYKGFRFDIGGHRFFTKDLPVRRLWQSLLGEDLLLRPRLSRIYYDRKFLDYPLKPLNVFVNLGFSASVHILLSYLWRKLNPVSPETSIADWVTNRFGSRLYTIFFKSYTEKVWGVPCDKIGAQWAAQRIRGLSLRTTLLNMFAPVFMRKGGKGVRTLTEEFLYPRLGPGMMWDALASSVRARGGELHCNCTISGLQHDGGKIATVVVEREGQRDVLPVSHVISTMPLNQLIHALDPAPPDEVASAADKLRYRDFLTVALIIDKPDLFPDNWLYIHDVSLRVGRIQNYKNWSPEMVPDPAKTCLGMEYFCFAGDELWGMRDEDLIVLATRELAAVGLATPDLVRDGAVVRLTKAYPMYDEGFQEALGTIRHYLDRFDNLQSIGRNGMHRYNNMDHSMLTAMLAARNLFGKRHDLWEVNSDDGYHENFSE